MAINDISLTSGMRANLVSLQSTVTLLNRTQQRLSTGKAVNSALDNPVNFFAAQALNNRAADLAGYKDGMSNGIQTIQAANQGISSITTLINAAKALAQSATGLGSTGSSGSQYDTAAVTLNTIKVGDTITLGKTTFTAVTGTAAADQFSIGTNDSTLYTSAQVANNLAASISADATVSSTIGPFQVDSVNGNTLTIKGLVTTGGTSIANTDITASSDLNVSIVKGNGVGNSFATEMLTLNNVKVGDTVMIGSTTFTAVTGTAAADKFSIGIDDSHLYSNSQVASNLAASIGKDTTVSSTIGPFQVASVSGNTLNIKALTTTGGTNIANTDIISSQSIQGTVIPAGSGSNSKLQGLVDQYKSMLSQIDTMAADSSFQGVNLLTTASPSALVVNFGGGHSLNVQGFDATSSGLGLSEAQNGWVSNDAVTKDINKLNDALTTLQNDSGSMSNNLSIIQTRQDFSTQLTNVLTTGSDNLTLADTNQEGANMLMLQTRQSLGTTALSLSSQAAQSVLRLFA